MRVVGTAGHVDHGKSALVLALTGINPDRLVEEQERQMTIDLGFAWMALPDGEEIGIIDVPGHQDFIENMLAGIGGIDTALLVIAADEGVMPQTREHLSILDLLDINHAVVALTKIDLITDSQWLSLVEEEVREVLYGTALSNAPIIPVSARIRKGIEELKNALAIELKKSAPKPDLGRPRLPIDRAFSIAGFGTVVTGTLTDGSFHVGDEVVILPTGLKGKIRGLQTHKMKVESAIPGSRTAINLTGIEVREVERGFVIASPATYQPTDMIDVYYRHLLNVSEPIKHDQWVKLFIGSTQCLARVRLLGMDQIIQGGEGWLQLILEQQIVAARGDHYILRRPSPGKTLGGGRVVDPHPTEKHRRMNKAILSGLENLLRGTPREILVESLKSLGPIKLNEAIRHSRLGEEVAHAAALDLYHQGELINLASASEPKFDDFVTHVDVWRAISSKAEGIVRNFHSANPLRSGVPREELKSRMGYSNHLFQLMLERFISEGILKVIRKKIAIFDYEPKLNDEQRRLSESLLQRFNANPYTPPSAKECLQSIGPELFNFLLDQSQLIHVAEDVVFERSAYEEMIHQIRQKLKDEGSIAVAEVRDNFNTSRKFALALMEHLDSIGITVREGDVRRLADAD